MLKKISVYFIIHAEATIKFDITLKCFFFFFVFFVKLSIIDVTYEMTNIKRQLFMFVGSIYKRLLSRFN